MVSSELACGNITKTILKLAIPQMLAQFINVLYSIIDRVYISNLAVDGDIALTAIGVCAPVCTMIASFSSLLGQGGGPLMEMKVGQKDVKGAEKILANAFLMLVIAGILIPLIMLIFHKNLLNLFGASESTYNYARDYMMFYLIGAPFQIAALGLNYYLTSQGYSNKAMFTMLLGALINIALDPVFIFGFNLGVKGAAIATSIAQIASFIYVVIVLRLKSTEVKLTVGGYNLKDMKKIVFSGISPFIILMTDSLVLVFLNMSLKMNMESTLADKYILAATIITSFYQLFSMPLLGISGGTGSILSYNFGAKNSLRVKKSEKVITIFALIFTTFSVVLSCFVSRPFFNYMTTDEFVLDLCSKMVWCYMAPFIILSFQYAFVDGLTALGKANIGIYLSLNRKITNILLILILPRFVGGEGVFYAESVADVWSSLTTLVVFLLIINKILKKNEIKDDNINLSQV